MARYRVVAHDTKVIEQELFVEAGNEAEAITLAEESYDHEWTISREELFTSWEIYSARPMKA